MNTRRAQGGEGTGPDAVHPSSILSRVSWASA